MDEIVNINNQIMFLLFNLLLREIKSSILVE